MAANYERVYYKLASLYATPLRSTAARPKQTLRQLALARIAARQWQQTNGAEHLNGDSVKTPARPALWQVVPAAPEQEALDGKSLVGELQPGDTDLLKQ